MAQVTSFTQSSIANLYIAILGRNPEPSGFGYWCDVLANNNNSQAAINAIAEGFAKTPEFISVYGGRTTTQAVTAMYNNVLNRAPDATGLAYWTAYANALITAGQEVGDAYALTGNAIITVAAANNGTADQTLINGKQATAIASGLAAPSTTIALTANIDTLTVGSNTTVIGTVTDTAAQTLNAGDSITGTGTGNTLRIIDTTDAANLSPMIGITLSGIQTVSVQNATGVSDNIYSMANTTGVTTVQSSNSGGGDTIFTGLAAGTTVSVSGSSAAESTTIFGYTSSTGAVTVNLNGGLTTVQTVTNYVSDAASAAATSATITSTGGVNGTTSTGAAAAAILNLTKKASDVAGAGANSLTNLTVNAATNMRVALNATDFNSVGAALVVAGAATSVNLGNAGVYRTIDASGLSAGGVTVNASSTLTSFIGGGGNDSLTQGAAAATIASTSSINAGTGTDTLAAVLANAGNAAVFNNFEILSTGGSAAALSFDTALLVNSSISGVNLAGHTGGTATFTNLVMPTTGFNVTVSANNGQQSVLGFTAASIAGAADVVNFNFASTSGGTTAASTVTIQGVELVNINSGGISGSNNSITLAGNAVQSVTVTGNRAMSLTFTDQTVSSTATTPLTVVNASGMTPASSTIGFTFIETGTSADGTAAGITVTGSSSNDAFTVITTNATATRGNFGADTVVLSNGGFDTVTVTGATAKIRSVNDIEAFAATTVVGAAAGDVIVFGTASATGALGNAVNVSAQTSLLSAVNFAINNTGSSGTTANFISWFNFGGNTYVVSNVDGGTNLDPTDIVVALTGVLNLGSSTTVAGSGALTIV